MGDHIKTRQEYLEGFPDQNIDKEEYKKALESALHNAYEMRKIADDGYWMRAAYFWGLLIATFAGYGTVYTSDNGIIEKVILLLVISCFGLVLSFAWYLVNRGSKYWLVSWERHVDILETELKSPLYRRNLSPKEFIKWRVSTAYPFSVSKINCLISAYAAALWLIILSYDLFIYFGALPIPFTKPNEVKIFVNAFETSSRYYLWFVSIILLLTVTCVIWLWSSKTSKEICKINFRQRKIKDA